MEQDKNWYDRNYKKLLVIPVIIFLLSVAYLGVFYKNNGDIIYKDVSLTGGTSITVLDENVDVSDIENFLNERYPDVLVRKVSDFETGRQQGFFVEARAEVDDLRGSLEEYLGYELNSENSSTEFTGSTISEGFYRQLQIAIIIAFAFMAISVFFIYRTFVPSAAVIFSAFADIIVAVVIVDLLGIKLSMAGIIAFLMLIGYSVDTDIMLTSKLLRKRDGNESTNKILYNAFKTGMTMTLTSLIGVSVSLLITYSLSDTLRQIFTVLLIGLVVDIGNTWLTNSSILKWYVESKK